MKATESISEWGAVMRLARRAALDALGFEIREKGQ